MTDQWNRNDADAVRVRADRIRRTAWLRTKILRRGCFVVTDNCQIGYVVKEGEPEGYVRGPNVKVWITGEPWWEWMNRKQLSPLNEEEWAILRVARGLDNVVCLADRRRA